MEPSGKGNQNLLLSRPFRLLPSETVITAYLLFTAGIVIIFHDPSGRWLSHLLVRLGIILAFFVFSMTENIRVDSKALLLVRRFFPFVLLGYLYAETGYFNELTWGKGALDPYIVAAEEAMFGMQPSLLFAERFDSGWFSELMYLGYFSYYGLVLLVPLYIYLTKGKIQGERWVFLILASFLLYYSIFILLPVSGPQFFFSETAAKLPEGYFFGRLTRWVITHFEVAAAAFPSSHVSICLMLVWACYKEAKRLLPAVALLALILVAATVYIRAHYLVDVIVAFMVTPLVYLSSWKLYQVLTKTKTHSVPV